MTPFRMLLTMCRKKRSSGRTRVSAEVCGCFFRDAGVDEAAARRRGRASGREGVSGIWANTELNGKGANGMPATRPFVIAETRVISDG
jgi:hypothetical protein